MTDPKQIAYKILDAMTPGQRIKISEFAPNNPELFIQCVKDYIDDRGPAEFNNEYSVITKLHPIPRDNMIHVHLEFKE